MERSVDKLARYTIYAVVATAILALCLYFSNVLIYIIAAVVVSLVAIPVKRFIGKILIAGKRLPNSLGAALSLFLVVAFIIGLITRIVPIIYNIVYNISENVRAAYSSSLDFSTTVTSVNEWITSTFPSLGADFRIEVALTEFIQSQFDISSLPSMVGSFASAAGSVVVALFSIIFISYFFIRDDKLFSRILCAISPDKIESRVILALDEIEGLLSRYFAGLMIEILGVATLNFLGLWIIAGLDASTSLAIAFITGILNVIPYVGPWIGAAIGTVLGLVMRFSLAAVAGEALQIGPLALIFLAVFLFTQLVDNFVFQPVIYSKSVKASALEIFIVMLLAGQVGGILGMIVAIPAYTVIRVVAITFFPHCKPIRRLLIRS